LTIGKAITVEEKRLAALLNKFIKKDIRLKLDKLLETNNNIGFYRISGVKLQ